MKARFLIISLILFVSCVSSKDASLSTYKEGDFKARVHEFCMDVDRELVPRFKNRSSQSRIIYFAYVSLFYTDSNCDDIKGLTKGEFLERIFFQLGSAYCRIVNEQNKYIGILSETLISDDPKAYKSYCIENKQNHIFLENDADLLFVISNCEEGQLLNYLFLYDIENEDVKIFILENDEYSEISYDSWHGLLKEMMN